MTTSIAIRQARTKLLEAIDRASYAEMLANAGDQSDAFGHSDEEAIACFCGD